MSLSRRTFLKVASLFTVTSIAAIKGFNIGSTKTVEETITELLIKTNGVLENQTFILSKPLNFYDCEGLIIKHCTFKPSLDFEGDALIVLDKTNELTISNCLIKLEHLSDSDGFCALKDCGNTINTIVDSCHFDSGGIHMGFKHSIPTLYKDNALNLSMAKF